MTLTDKCLTLFTADQVSVEIQHPVDATALCTVTIFVCSIWIRSVMFIDGLLEFMGSVESEFDQTMAMKGALGGLVLFNSMCGCIATGLFIKRCMDCRTPLYPTTATLQQGPLHQRQWSGGLNNFHTPTT